MVVEALRLPAWESTGVGEGGFVWALMEVPSAGFLQCYPLHSGYVHAFFLVDSVNHLFRSKGTQKADSVAQELILVIIHFSFE
jgi:hypothetical protein